MNDDQLESGLGTALREYADDIHPDLDALARTSRAAGGRIRARRRMGGSLAAAAAVAGIVGVATVGSQLGHSNAATNPGFAGQPTTAGSAAGHPKGCAQGPKVLDRYQSSLRSTTPRFHTTSGRGPVVSGLDLQGLTGRIRQAPSGAKDCTLAPLKTLGSGDAPPAIYHGQDVAIHLAGWKQVGTVADDKQSLEGPGGAVADIVWRPAADHDAWASSTDKGNAAGVWTSEVHDGVFVSIQAGSGTSDADVQALGASLTWG
ncbi:hypothetical protein [Nocardioides ultimimeridianus]